MSIGERIRTARKAKKLTQSELAERCGISRNGQSNFEKDENQPGAAYLLALDAIGIDAGYILTGRPSVSTPTEAALLQAFRAASAEKRAIALQILEVTAVSGDAGAQQQQIHGDIGMFNTAPIDTDQPIVFNVGGGKRRKK